MRKLFTIFLLFCLYFSYSANISVDQLEIASSLGFDTTDNKLKNITFFNLLTSISGGYKFSATLGFQANSYLLEDNYLTNGFGPATIYLLFNSATINARDLANSLLDISFWTGVYKYLGGGSFYKGYAFFPKSWTEDIKGFYRLRGTGISTNLKFFDEKLRFKFHLYENTNFIQPGDPWTKLNYFTFDSEIGLYLDYLYLEGYFGYTKDIVYPNDNSSLLYGRGKAGINFWVGNKDIEFFTTIGYPNLDEALFSGLTNGTTNMFDALYLLAELRFQLFVTNNIITFLTLPSIYNEQNSNMKTDFNINYKLMISSKDKLINGGFNLNFKYNMLTATTFDWSLELLPYFSIIMAGVEWYISNGYDFSVFEKAYTTSNNLYYLQGIKTYIGVSSSF